jgi:hypothetical protein
LRAHAHSDGDGDTYGFADGYFDIDGNFNAYTYSDVYAHMDSHSDLDGHPHEYTYGDLNDDGDVYGDSAATHLDAYPQPPVPFVAQSV